jgi:protein-serine/threonine kinase
MIIDFGSSAFVEDGPFTTFYGTKDYAPPEALEGKSYTGKPQDMWQLGMLLFILLFREHPFSSVEETLQCNLKEGLDLSSEGEDLLRRLLERDCQLRLTIEQAESHHWLKPF